MVVSRSLTAVLQSMQSSVDSDTADALLQTAINTLEGRVDSIPPSQIPVNGGWIDQSRFSVSNGTPRLNLSLGMWEWLVQRRFSDLQQDAARVRHAQAGHFSVEPNADCLCYFPFIGGLTGTWVPTA